MGGDAGAGGSGSGTGGIGGSGGGSGGLGPAYCSDPPAGVVVGFEVGDQLADIVVKDCEGNDYSLTELCGAKALHIFAAHGWCPLCKGFSAEQEALQDELAAEGLASVNIVLEKASGEEPDAAYCKLWRDTHGLEDVVTLYDPTGVAKVLWSNTSSLSAFLSKDQVIVSKLEHDGNVSTIKARIQEALAK
jgi:AhpC/TSA family protein